MKPIVLITGEAHPILTAGLSHLGYEVLDRPTITRTELLETVPEVTALILTSRHQIDSVVFEKAAKLKWIGRLGSGLDVVDRRIAAEKNVSVFSSPEGNRQAVAEHTVGLLLNLIRNQSKSDREVRRGSWNRNENRGYELGGLTAALIGYGNTGEATARLLTSLGMSVLAFDKYRSGFGGEWATESDMQQIRAQADVVSLHLPLTEETKALVDDRWIESFAKPIWLINTSRGSITPLAPLIHQLEQGRLRGLALDVLPKEPLTYYTDFEKRELDKLCSFDQVILTPHVAGYSWESPERMARVLLEKLIDASSQGRAREGAQAED
jgi:D-3-phosphoglycerate dehydrogenase